MDERPFPIAGICVLGGIAVALLAAGILLSSQVPDPWEHAVLAVMFATLGVLFFIGFLALGRSMREGLSASIITVFLTLISVFSFYNYTPPEWVRSTLITQFTAVVSVVVAFYFSSQAVSEYIQYKERAPDRPAAERTRS
jgi:hypothetical protein